MLYEIRYFGNKERCKQAKDQDRRTSTVTKMKQSDTVDNNWEWSWQGLSCEGTFKLRCE